MSKRGGEKIYNNTTEKADCELSFPVLQHRKRDIRLKVAKEMQRLFSYNA